MKIKISKCIKAIEGYVYTKIEDDNSFFEGVYVGDLLSHVMANLSEGNAWITILTNLNVVAVANLAEAACIIIPEGIEPTKALIEKSQSLGIVVIGTKLKAYDICVRINGLENE